MSRVKLENDVLTLEYSLFDLPTAQHKAGLAGLVVMIESLKRRKISPLPEVVVKPAKAVFTFTQESLQTVFDDLYDAEWVEAQAKQKWAKQKPKRIDEKEVEVNGKKKKEKYFIYDAVQAKGAFLQSFYPDDDGAWVHLWRNMLWSILRGIPATRKVYEERANDLPSSEAQKLWKTLKKYPKNTKKEKEVASSVFIGAEAENPERVPFQGSVENNFILSFWPIVSLIFAPRSIEIKRTEDRLSTMYHNEGYALAIPEPFELEDFTGEAIEMLRSLNPKKSGFRPHEALIDVFEESALEYLYRFVQKKAENAGEAEFTGCLHALEIYHLEKQGNRIRQLSADRILPDSDIIKTYGDIRGKIGNPFYKKIYLRNLLDGRPWYENADDVFHHNPMPIFVQSAKSPKTIRFFGSDVKAKFSSIIDSLKNKKGVELMSEKDHDDQLALRVNRLIRTYVQRRSEEKSGKKYKDFKNNKKKKNGKEYTVYPKEYREALEKVCSDAFLAMRGRREQDFIEYFTGTICSVPQFLPEEEFLSISKTLMNDWQRIKTLSMLSVSANSYIFDISDKKED